MRKQETATEQTTLPLKWGGFGGEVSEGAIECEKCQKTVTGREMQACPDCPKGNGGFGGNGDV